MAEAELGVTGEAKGSNTRKGVQAIDAVMSEMLTTSLTPPPAREERGGTWDAKQPAAG